MADKDFRVKNGIIVGANAHIEGSITSVDSIQLDTLNPIEPLSAGQMSWNVDSNTVSVGLSVGSVELGQEEHIYIKNQSGNTIGKGNTVMFTGTLGASGRILGDKAIMDGTYPSSYFIGIAKHDIANGDDGYVTSFGKIDQLDTSMFSEGDILYADPGTPGGLSNTAPVAPNNYVTAAAVVHSDATTGVLFVRPTYEGSIEDKEDVFINSIQDGEALIWRSANARFENGSAGSALELYAENPSSPTAPSATGLNAVAIGSGATATGDQSFSFGHGADATAFRATAVGGDNIANIDYAAAFGFGANATGNSATSLGRSASASGASSVALGYTARATGQYAVGIGFNADALATSSLAIGHNAQTITGSYATALTNSYASGADSFAAAIGDNTSSYGATGANSVALGYRAKATGQYSFSLSPQAQATNFASIAIGFGAQASGSVSIAIGGSCIASGQYAVAIGNSTRASAKNSFASGFQAKADIEGKYARASKDFASTQGTAQYGHFVLCSDTTNATPEALTTNNSTASTTNQIILPNNSAYFFSGTIIARQDAASGTAMGAWEIKGAIRREGSAATTTLVKSTIDEFSAPAGWSISLTADTTNGGLKIEVTGAAATNIRWVATVHTSEVTY